MSADEMNESFKRAHTYAAIFINVGDRWADYVPVDAMGTVTESGVTVGDVVMERAESNGWRLNQGDSSWLIRSTAKDAA